MKSWMIDEHSRPGYRWETFEDILREVFRREVAILKQGTSFHLDIAYGSKFFH